MALIKCPKCSSEISDKATACPKCGNPMVPVVAGASQSVMNRDQLMEKYGISFDGKHYFAKDYRYTQFDDALAFAKSQTDQPNLTHVANSPASRLSVSVLGGSGWPLRQGQIYYLSIGQRALNLQPGGSEANMEIPFSDLTAIEIYGPGTQSTNAGLIGGGFGLEGAALGILAAGIVNLATSRSKTNTFLRLATRESEVFLHTSLIEPAALRMLLSSAVVEMEAKRLGAFKDTNVLSNELRELHSLTLTGVLTADEFQLAKRRLLTDQP